MSGGSHEYICYRMEDEPKIALRIMIASDALSGLKT